MSTRRAIARQHLLDEGTCARRVASRGIGSREALTDIRKIFDRFGGGLQSRDRILGATRGDVVVGEREHGAGVAGFGETQEIRFASRYLPFAIARAAIARFAMLFFESRCRAPRNAFSVSEAFPSDQ